MITQATCATKRRSPRVQRPAKSFSQVIGTKQIVNMVRAFRDDDSANMFPRSSPPKRITRYLW